MRANKVAISIVVQPCSCRWLEQHVLRGLRASALTATTPSGFDAAKLAQIDALFADHVARKQIAGRRRPGRPPWQGRLSESLRQPGRRGRHRDEPRHDLPHRLDVQAGHQYRRH